MPRTVVVHQPDFFSYLGFFQRFLHADIYVALDTVQFSAANWTHRDKIKTVKGAAWLSLSIQRCPLATPIKDVSLSPEARWREANLNLLRQNYGDSPFFDTVFTSVEALYARTLTGLSEFNLASIDLVCGLLDISIPRVLASTFTIEGRASELVAGLVEAVGGATYLSGQGARDYHDQAPFDRRGIAVAWQQFRHPVYPQLHGAFIAGLSVLDALFNCGPRGTRALLEEG